MRKLTREERLDLKYGNPFLKAIANKNHVALEYYKMYVDSQREAHMDELRSCVAYIGFIAVVTLGVLLSEAMIILCATTFIVIGMGCGLDARIERLWSSRFSDGVFSAAKEAMSREEDKKDGR